MPVLASQGIPRDTAGLVAAAIPLFSIPGRFGFGWMGDVTEKRYVMAAAFVGVTLAEDDRADRMRIAEADHAVAGDHRHHGIATTAAGVHAGDGGKHVFLGRLQLAAHRQLMGEHVEQHFRVGVGVDVAQVGLVDLA